MASWYVEKEGRRLGPFTGSQLKELAALGRLGPDDLVGRGDHPKKVRAAEVRGLFRKPDDVFTHGEPPAPAPTGPSPPPTSEGRPDGIDEGWKGLARASKAAAGLATAQARKLHLERVVLPSACGALGLDIYTSGRFREDFPELFAEIGECERQIERVAAARAQIGRSKGMAGRAAEAAVGVKVQAQAKALSLKRESLLRRLGESTFAKHGDGSGPDAFVRPIGDGLSKVNSLDQEILRLSQVAQGRLATPKRILVGTVGLGVVALVLAVWNAKDSAAPGGPGTFAGPAVALRDEATGPGAVGVAVPDFSQVDYSYDFSTDDYEAVPPNAKRRKRSKIIEQADLDEIDAGNPHLIGKWVDEDGYSNANGGFVRQGRRIIWFDGDRRDKYCEDMWLGGRRHGPMAQWRKGGAKASEVTFVNGELHGQVRHWYEGGQASIQAAFLHGKQHGLRIEWYANGQKELEVAYVNGLRQGPMRAWYENGGPKEESLVVDDKYEGLARVWGPQSQQPDELNYRDGKLHGLVIRHTRDGGTTSRATYRDGVLVVPALDVRKLSVSEFLGRMQKGSVLTRRSSRSLGSIWWEDAWFEMFGPPQRGAGTYKWSYSCLDGVLELTNRPVQEGEGQEGQIWVSVYSGSD